MVDLYLNYLRAISRRRLIKKINEAAGNGYVLIGSIERRPFAWIKWRATMRFEGTPTTTLGRLVDQRRG